jgi:hypothetical protein
MGPVAQEHVGGVRWGLAVALASLAAFAALVLLVLGWVVAAGILALASMVGPAVAQAFVAEDSSH